MKKTARFVIWICSKSIPLDSKHLTGFTREEIEQIIQGLLDVLANRNPDVKPKDDFKEKHPNYRNFFVDPNPPLKTPPKTRPKLDWRKLLSTYETNRGYPLKAVAAKDPKTKVPEGSTCRICNAPCQYLYFNDGKNRTQLKCKVCFSLTQVHPVIAIKLNTFGLIVVIHFIFGKRREMSLSINATIIDAPLFQRTKPSSILEKGF